MSNLRSWLRGSSSTAAKVQPLETPAPSPSNVSKNEPATSSIQQELGDIEHAMAAADLIMNDDIEGAEKQFYLRKDTSSFHQLGLGVCTFMTSILGFEKEVMAEAASRLAESESRAWDDLKKAQKEAQKAAGGGSSWFGNSSATAETAASTIYPPGSEFALIHAMSQLMNAVVAVLHESLTEALKGFYKLRKAFLTLDGIMEAEMKYVSKVEHGGVSRPATAQHRRLSEDMMPGSFDEAEFDEFDENPEQKQSDSDPEFVDASSTAVSGKQTPTGTPTIRPTTPSTQSTTQHSRTTSIKNLSSQAPPQPLPSASATRSPAANPELFKTPVDIFIHSGANMCFGVLLLIISMVPPAFSRLLYIIGFKGDRERGVSMLWQSTSVRNVNGAIAGLILLGYYNGLLGFADILPSDADVAELAEDDEVVGYPRERCFALLADMTARYPDSRLWKLQEARELANNRRLEEAVAMLAANGDAKMRQIAALNAFELSLDTLFVMGWQGARDGFLRCVELNKWSHAVYYYMVGCAELEMYRDAWHRGKSAGDEREVAAAQTEARRHKKAAEDNFRKAPTVAGRKKFMARQMPFEVFVCRKVQKWEERAASLGVELADAPVVSPAMEMVYLWNGSKRMSDALLARARAYNDLGRCTMSSQQREKVLADEKDEGAVWAVAEAALLRSLGRTDEAREVLAPVVKTDRTIFKGPTRDDYVLPAALYEVAAAAWRDGCNPAKWPAGKGPDEVDAYRRRQTEECLGYLEKLAKWESYVLDGRFGMRIQAALDSVKWLKGKKGW